jgi:hypothetical protein
MAINHVIGHREKSIVGIVTTKAVQRHVRPACLQGLLFLREKFLVGFLIQFLPGRREKEEGGNNESEMSNPISSPRGIAKIPSFLSSRTRWIDGIFSLIFN